MSTWVQESTSSVRERLIRDLPRNEEFRYDYDEEFSDTYISTQIRVLREQREMTQAQLASAAGTGQSKISEMERDYHSWSIRTLRNLARALGVRLSVTFESWGELIPRVENFRRENLDRPEIEDDPTFKWLESTSSISTATAPAAFPALRGFVTRDLVYLSQEPRILDRSQLMKPSPARLGAGVHANG